VSGLLIGYARVSTDAQDLSAQRDALAALDVPTERIHVDHGLTGTELAELFNVARSTVYRVLTRARHAAPAPDAA
jgi:DNA invertase Pin-like site-specific DNA recombinase